MRAVITDLSGDRTVLDINCVDYPSLTFKGVKRDDLFMLFAQALLPPQVIFCYCLFCYCLQCKRNAAEI